MVCAVCGKEMFEANYNKGQWEYKKGHNKKGEKVYCSVACSKEYCRKVSSETMTKTNLKYAEVFSERMRTDNPMFRQDIRELVSIKGKGRPFVERGGNGKQTPVPQQMVFDAIQEYKPVLEYVLRTGERKDSGFPSHYKIDIALPYYKIAIEIDGNSHHLLSRKAQDTKKENFLSNLGWITLRFKNKEVLDDLNDCIGTIKAITRWYYGE